MKTEPELIVDSDGSKKWYLNGKRHREDGPAVEWADGSKEWYLNGKKLFSRQLNSKKIQKEHPVLYNAYLIYHVMNQ